MVEGLRVFLDREGLCALLSATSAAAAFRRGLGPVVLVQFDGLREFIVQLHLRFLGRERQTGWSVQARGDSRAQPRQMGGMGAEQAQQ